MPTYTFDPTLSELFLNFQAYSESITINFKDRITQIYNHEPIYFSRVPNIEINAQLKIFTDSPQFKIFTSQLDHCFFTLANFINTYNIQVTTTLEALTNDPTRQTQIEVNANRLLDRFLQRLKSDYYDNRRVNLYDGGKRYLEMLSILIDQTEINLVDRITQLKALIDEDALEKCADGCYSRLQETAENLEAIIFLDVQKWIKNFLKNQLTESIRKPISSISDTTLTKKIADIIERREDGHEIHCYNWLVEILSNELGFSFIKSSKDAYVVWINENLEKPENSNQKIKVLDIVEQGKKKLIQSITATHLVEFINNEIYQSLKQEEASLESSVRYSELVNIVEGKLAVLGVDDTFSLGEIFDINGELKSEFSLYKTITLRLLNKGFFRQPIRFSTDHYQLAVFKKNLQLGLITVLNDREILPIVDFIEKPGSLSEILNSVAVEQRSELFNQLIQSKEDFIIFLNSVDFGSLLSISSLLSKSLDSLGFSNAVLQVAINQPPSEFLSTFEAIFTILEKLDGSLIDEETAKIFFHEQMIKPAVFEGMLRHYLGLRLDTPDKYSVLDVRTILDKLLLMDLPEFNQISFDPPQFADLDPLRTAEDSYLQELNLVKIKIHKVNVHVRVKRCLFMEATIWESYFHEEVSSADFSKAKLDQVHFKILCSSELAEVEFSNIKVSERMEDCYAKEATFEKAFLAETHRVFFKSATLLDIQFSEVSDCNFVAAKLINADIKYAKGCSFLGAELDNVAFGHILDNVSSRNEQFSFRRANLKNISFSSINLRRDKIDFSYAKLEDSIFRSFDLRQAIFKGTRFRNVEFNHIDFSNVLFKKIKFESDVIFDNCKLTQATFRNCDLTRVAIKENNLLVGVKLEEVTLTPYQLMTYYGSNVLDFSTITLDNGGKNPFEIEIFLSMCRLDGARLSPQAFRYLCSKNFGFRGVDLRHIDFKARDLIDLKEKGLTSIDLKGATITFTQALQLQEQGFGNFFQTTIFIDSNSIEESIQKLKDFMNRDQVINEEAKKNDIVFLLFLFEKINNDLVDKTLNNEVLIAKARGNLPDQAVGDDGLRAIVNMQQKVELQRQACEEIAKIIFTQFDTEQQQIMLEKMTQYALQRDALGEGMAAGQLRFLRATILTTLSNEVLSYHMTFFKEKFFQVSTSDERAVLDELLNDLIIGIAARCGDLSHRKKRSAVECVGLDELINVDETQAITQAKEISLLVAAERRLLWQKSIGPLLDELNQAGEQWVPLLETARDLGNDRETIEFINVRTQEKQIHELSGKCSLNFLASLRELHQFIPQEKFRENVKNLAEDLTIKRPRDQFKYDENNFSGDFLLAVGLTTKTIINLINNKGCTDNVNNSSSSTDLEHVECGVNIAGMSALYLTVTLQLAELIQKDFLTQQSLLLNGLSVTSKVFGGINVLFLLAQDGFDLVKLVQASSEKETAGAVTQLVIDGTLTAQTFVSLVAEGLMASVSSALIVPFMGLGVGLSSLVNNYETLLEMALQTGRFFNILHEQQKKGGYEWVTQTKLKDDNGNERTVLLNETQRFMKPVDMVVTTKIDFVSGKLVLKGPWIYSSMNKGLCYYVDHNKDNAFDFREGIDLPNTIPLSATHLSIKTWLLPYPNFYINYEYQTEPFITLRHDAELDTLRELQKNKKFISNEYCFPTEYVVYKYHLEFMPTTIKIVVDAHARTFVIPRLEEKLHGLLTYEMDSTGLLEEGGQRIIYLNPGVSIHLYLTQYSWILNGQNLSKDTIEFTQQGLIVGDVVIKELFDTQALTSSNQVQPLVYVNKQGHVFKVDLEQKQMRLMTLNYAALQKSQQTLDEFLRHQQPNSPVVRVINYHNPDDGYEGTATYVVAKKRLFYTLNTFEPSNDAVLISLQKQAAFFYDENSRLLWCTETDSNRLLYYYVFAGEINSISQQANDLLINVANQFYYTINTVTKESLLMAVQNANLLTLSLKLHAKLSLIDVNDTDNRYKFNVTQTKEGQELTEQIQTLIRSALMEARQAGSLYQKIHSEMKSPNLSDISIGLRVASNVSPFIWLRKEKDHYQLISMQTRPLDENTLENNEYRKANIKSGQYLGCFFDNQQPDTRILSYFVKENSTDTTGKLYLQTVNAQQMLVSFNNTPPRLLVDLLVKNAVWNDNKLMVLTADNTYQAIDASAQTSLIGFTADWVQENPNWWQAVAVYLEKNPSKQVLISVQGINDQRGNALIVYYDHRVQQFIIINQANLDAVYQGKIGKVYFFTKDNCAYQVQGMTAEQIQALFNGPQAKQSLPAPTKIADYHSLNPLGTPTENDQLFMQKLPRFSLALQEFRVWLPEGAELAFDPNDGAWQVLAIQAGWFNLQENLPRAVSELFGHIAKLFKLKENQLNTPIPVETTDFCLVENDRFIEIPDVRWPNEQFNYLGQTDQPGYYFYDASRKAIILLTSSNRNDFEKGHSHYIKPEFAMEYATKLNEVSVLLEIDPLHIQMQDIPLFKGCYNLLLSITANTGSHLITLPESLMNHYTTIIYQAEGAYLIELPNYSWFARKNQHSLMLSNGHSQLVIPYASDSTLPNIMLQVSYVHANQSQVFKENTLFIDRKLARLSPLNSIPILGYGLNWIEEVRLLPDAAAGHYQKENLAVEPVADKLSGQRMPEKVGSASFLSQALMATVSAMTSFALTTAMGLSYVFVRRFWRPAPATAIKNTLAAISIPMTAIPITEAQSMSNEDQSLGDATVVNSGESMTAEDSQYGFYESEILEHGFSKLTQSWSSVAAILAVESKKRREERFVQLDVGRKVRLKQIEHMQAQQTLHTLTNAFIAGIVAKLKNSNHVNSTELKAWIVKDLMAEYRNYLNDPVSESRLVSKFDIWLNRFLSAQKEEFVHDQKLLLAQALTSSSFSGLLNHLFIDKVCQMHREMLFSENQELAEQQKRAVLKIMPSLLQSQEAFIASLSIAEGTDYGALAENSADKQRFELACKSKQSIAQKYLPISGWVFNYFKPVKATEIEKTMSSKKVMQQYK